MNKLPIGAKVVWRQEAYGAKRHACKSEYHICEIASQPFYDNGLIRYEISCNGTIHTVASTDIIDANLVPVEYSALPQTISAMMLDSSVSKGFRSSPLQAILKQRIESGVYDRWNEHIDIEDDPLAFPIAAYQANRNDNIRIILRQDILYVYGMDDTPYLSLGNKLLDVVEQIIYIEAKKVGDLSQMHNADMYTQAFDEMYNAWHGTSIAVNMILQSRD